MCKENKKCELTGLKIEILLTSRKLIIGLIFPEAVVANHKVDESIFLVSRRRSGKCILKIKIEAGTTNCLRQSLVSCVAEERRLH